MDLFFRHREATAPPCHLFSSDSDSEEDGDAADLRVAVAAAAAAKKPVAKKLKKTGGAAAAAAGAACRKFQDGATVLAVSTPHTPHPPVVTPSPSTMDSVSQRGRPGSRHRPRMHDWENWLAVTYKLVLR